MSEEKDFEEIKKIQYKFDEYNYPKDELEKIYKFDELLELSSKSLKRVPGMKLIRLQDDVKVHNLDDIDHNWENCFYCIRQKIDEMLNDCDFLLILLKYRPDTVPIVIDKFKKLYNDDKQFTKNIDLFKKILKNEEYLTESEKQILLSIRIYFWSDLKKFTDDMIRYLRCYVSLRKINTYPFTIEELYICHNLLEKNTPITLSNMLESKQNLYKSRKILFKNKPTETTFGTIFLGSDRDNFTIFNDILYTDFSIDRQNYKDKLSHKEWKDEFFVSDDFIETKNKIWAYIENTLIKPSRFKHKKKSNIKSIKKVIKKSIKKANIKSIKKVKSKNKSKKKSKSKRIL
jgi:hypothetical protein